MAGANVLASKRWRQEIKFQPPAAQPTAFAFIHRGTFLVAYGHEPPNTREGIFVLPIQLGQLTPSQDHQAGTDSLEAGVRQIKNRYYGQPEPATTA